MVYLDDFFIKADTFADCISALNTLIFSLVSSIKFRKGFVKFMILIALFKKFLS